MNRLLLTTTAIAALAGSPAFAQGTPGATPPTPTTQEEEQAQAGEQGRTSQSDQSDQGGIADIVVTAQRREERIQNVPISISAFSAEQLAAQGVSNTLQLAQYVPNLFAMNNTGLGSANSYYLRGLGNTETIATFDPPVGTYVDDIYISRQNANNLSLFDVERVEVLRGPQGTLFGRNTTGGAINIILRKPGRDFKGFAEVGYGRYDNKLARASFDLPVAESLSVKVSGYWKDDKGYLKNVTTGQRLNDDDGWGVRLGARAELSPSANWTGSYAHIVSKGENLLNFQCNPANPSDCKGRFATTGLREGNRPGAFAPLVIRGRKADYGLGNNAATDLITSNLELGIGDNLTLNVITGYVAISQQFALDFFDGRGAPSLAVPNPPVRGFPLGGFSITNDGSHLQFTQEVKLGGSLFDGFVDFVGGVFYINEQNRTDFADIFTLPIGATGPTGFPLLLADRILRNETDAIAGYVQADFNITDQVRLTAGVRYTDETKTFEVTDNRPQCTSIGGAAATCLETRNMVAPSGIRIPTEQRAKLWTPRFAANFRPNQNLLVFASATRGFKSGGWNARGTVASQLLPFGPEKAWSYEAGIKSDLLNRRVRANISVYQIDVQGLQVPSALVAPNGAITFITRNFADYRNRGVEGEFTVQPTRGLNLYTNVGYQNDEYKIDRSAPAVDIYGIQSATAQQAACRAALAAGNVPTGAGNTAACGNGIITATGEIATPVRTPRWTVSFGGSLEVPMGGSGMTLVPSLNARYQSKAETGTANYTIFTGPISGTNGSFPANPYAGDFIAGSLSPSNWLVNGGLSLNGPDKQWQLSLECTNCLNETVNQSSLANYTYISQPMMWFVRARHNF